MPGTEIRHRQGKLLSFTFTLLILTASVYLAFFTVYGTDIFDFETVDFSTTDAADCGAFQFFCDTFDLIGDGLGVIGRLLVLATFDTFTQETDVPTIISITLMILVGFPWGLIVTMGLIRGTSPS